MRQVAVSLLLRWVIIPRGTWGIINLAVPVVAMEGH
jgi:hypothetical protein